MSDGTPQADWYPDPGGSGNERYWDGERWTDQTRAPGSGSGRGSTSGLGGDPSPFGQPPQQQSPFGQQPPSFGQSPFGQPPAPYQQQSFQPAYVSPKSPALAVVLSIVWLGAGHFYAGRSDTTAILLAVGNAVLWLLFLLCFVGILGWIPLVIFASIDARKAAIDFNRRNGLATPT